MKKIFTLALLIVLTLSCTTLNPSAEPEQPASNTKTVTDPAQPIEAQSGATFEIVIDSNPTPAITGRSSAC